MRFFDGTQGVISYEALENAKSLPTFRQMYIDVGATSREDCPVRVGDVAAFDRPFLFAYGERLVSKAMDDRIGVAVLIETLRTSQKDTKPGLFRIQCPGRGRD